MKFYVYDPTPGSGDPGKAFGCYEAQTADEARNSFFCEWDYDEEYQSTPLIVREWQECDECGGTGLIPMPEDDPLREMYSDDEFMYFCPNCVLPEKEAKSE